MCLAYFIVITVAILPGCEKVSDYLIGNDELLRLVSPDKKVEAVLLRSKSAGATVSIYYQISIVPFGKKPTRSDTVFGAEKLEGESIEWVAPKVLEIKYKKARIIIFRNYWQSKEVENYGYNVEVVLEKKRERGATQ
jgi:hypothetical protein